MFTQDGKVRLTRKEAQRLYTDVLHDQNRVMTETLPVEKGKGIYLSKTTRLVREAKKHEHPYAVIMVR